MALSPARVEDLPRWDLSDLYPATDAPSLERDFRDARAAAEKFAADYQGRLSALTGAQMAEAVKRFEAIDETLTRIMSYAGLRHADNVADPAIGRFYQTAQERVTDISAQLVFFTLEINRIEDAAFEALLKDAALARYGVWLKDVRAFRKHQLSDEAERLLHERNVVGSAAWTRLFDETLAALRFPVRGESMPVSDALDKLTSTDGALRKEAAHAIGEVLNGNLRLFALITNTLAKEKEIDDRWRNFPSIVASRNLANQIEDEVVEALVAAVKQSYPRLSHRYYAMKARWFGADRLDYWDRNAPLPGDVDRVIPWAEARDIVLGAYDRFSPRLASLGKRFFDHPWIDVAPRPEKNSGAFAHPTVPSAHPYLLLNYHGKTRDVMTLAHELGHGVHQILAGGQGHLLSRTPLTLAETASVFGEMLTFRALLDRETDLQQRKIMLVGKVEDMLGTVIRQIAFHDFETKLHTARKQTELTPEEICDIWMSVQGESLGPALRFDDKYRSYWAYIPHFVHTPFYVYAYAFGDCLVNALYAVYQNADKGFAEKYLAMLAAGGSLRHKELLAPFGLDAGDPGFWAKGLSVIEGLIDEIDSIDRLTGDRKGA
jgi:oligoendopeptidase F